MTSISFAQMTPSEIFDFLSNNPPVIIVPNFMEGPVALRSDQSGGGDIYAVSLCRDCDALKYIAAIRGVLKTRTDKLPVTVYAADNASECVMLPLRHKTYNWTINLERKSTVDPVKVQLLQKLEVACCNEKMTPSVIRFGEDNSTASVESFTGRVVSVTLASDANYFRDDLNYKQISSVDPMSVRAPSMVFSFGDCLPVAADTAAEITKTIDRLKELRRHVSGGNLSDLQNMELSAALQVANSDLSSAAYGTCIEKGN